MNWHRDIPPVVFYVFGVMAIILLITNPFFLLVIVVLFAGGAAVGFLIDLVGHLFEKTKRSKDAKKRTDAIANDYAKKDAMKRVYDNDEASKKE
jgi:hypothetical protein